MGLVLEFGDHCLECEIVGIVVDLVSQNGYCRVFIVVLYGIVHQKFLIECRRNFSLIHRTSAVDKVHRILHQVHVNGMAHLVGNCALVIEQSLVVQKYERRSLQGKQVGSILNGLLPVIWIGIDVN